MRCEKQKRRRQDATPAAATPERGGITPLLYSGERGKATMKEKTRFIVLIIVMIIVGMALGEALSYFVNKRAEAAYWTESYPMANANITWTGAGYQGAGK
jgi:hypothetical protein